ncbi:hypothetical protein ANAEL_01861 [Anaerolineales bacterium]|nr:hypothetical protein ANAEL_01861 [Anaerolineales bacterium]
MDKILLKWHWFALLAGLGLYVLGVVPRLLPHTLDSVTVILAGVTIASIAVFGFGSTHVDRRLAVLMLMVSLIILTAGIVLARQGHNNLFWLLSVPVIGLGLFCLRKFFKKRER